MSYFACLSLLNGHESSYIVCICGVLMVSMHKIKVHCFSAIIVDIYLAGTSQCIMFLPDLVLSLCLTLELSRHLLRS